MLLGLRAASPTDRSAGPTDGDYEPLGINAAGAVWTTLTPTTAGGLTTHYLTSAASTNSTNVKNAAGQVYLIRAVNTTSTLYYLRMYNASAAPTCSSATNFVRDHPDPRFGEWGGHRDPQYMGQTYATGISYLPHGRRGSSTDNTNAATGVYFNHPLQMIIRLLFAVLLFCVAETARAAPSMSNPHSCHRLLRAPPRHLLRQQCDSRLPALLLDLRQPRHFQCRRFARNLSPARSMSPTAPPSPSPISITPTRRVPTLSPSRSPARSPMPPFNAPNTPVSPPSKPLSTRRPPTAKPLRAPAPTPSPR